MMKYFFLLAILSVLSFIVAAQSTTNLNITYLSVAGQAEKQVVQTHQLILNQDQSYYLMKQVEDDRPAMKKVEKENGLMHFEVVLENKGDSGIFTDRKSGRMISNAPLFDKLFLVKEPMPNISWSITGNYKKIAAYLCHEALGEFRGRKYAAWFTPDIPISSGPYKFGGLPGLILEVNELEGDFNWYCKSINPISEGEAVIFQEPTVGKSVSFSEFYEIVIKSIKRRMARMETNGNVTVGKIEINTDDWIERIK